MSVVPQHRRRGIAMSLLQSCERIGTRVPPVYVMQIAPSRVAVPTARWWAFDSIWLHVDAGNTAAQSLYMRTGYSEVGDALWWQGGGGRVLMRKTLEPLHWGGDPEGVGGAVNNGVFVWTTTPQQMDH